MGLEGLDGVGEVGALACAQNGKVDVTGDPGAAWAPPWVTAVPPTVAHCMRPGRQEGCCLGVCGHGRRQGRGLGLEQLDMEGASVAW